MDSVTQDPVNALEFVESSLQNYASLDASQKLQTSQMDHEINEIRGKYVSSITSLGVQKEEVWNKLRAFASENQKALFAVKKSMATKHGTFGFRTGKTRFTLVCANNWNTITEALKSMLPAYVRVEYSAAKDKLLYDRNLPEVNKFFPVLGIAVTQDETFYIDVNN